MSKHPSELSSLFASRRCYICLPDTAASRSYNCTSTSAPHSLGTCLETGNYTTGGWGLGVGCVGGDGWLGVGCVCECVSVCV